MSVETKTHQQYSDWIGLSVWKARIDFYESEDDDPQTVSSRWFDEYEDARDWLVEHERRGKFGQNGAIIAAVVEPDIYVDEVYGYVRDVWFAVKDVEQYWEVDPDDDLWKTEE